MSSRSRYSEALCARRDRRNQQECEEDSRCLHYGYSCKMSEARGRQQIGRPNFLVCGSGNISPLQPIQSYSCALLRSSPIISPTGKSNEPDQFDRLSPRQEDTECRDVFIHGVSLFPRRIFLPPRLDTRFANVRGAPEKIHVVSMSVVTEEHISEAREWILNFHKASASLNASHWITTFYSQDAVLEFANNAPLKGRQDIIKSFEQTFNLLESMEHIVVSIDVLSDKIYQVADIIYVVKGDAEKKPVRIRGLAVFGKKTNQSQLTYFTVFLDPSPLMERLKLVNSK